MNPEICAMASTNLRDAGVLCARLTYIWCDLFLGILTVIETVDENNERDDSGRNVSNRGDDGEQAKL